MELEKTIQEHRTRLNENLKSVDLGFWNKKGEYIKDVQIIDMSKEVENE